VILYIKKISKNQRQISAGKMRGEVRQEQ